MYKYLSQHPDIATSSPKEIHFFDTKENKAVRRHFENLPWRKRKHYKRYFRVNNWKEYTEAFDEQKSVLVDCTVGYVTSSSAIEKIKKEIHSPKFVILLREPYSRAKSKFLQNRRLELESHTDLKEAYRASSETKFDPEKGILFETRLDYRMSYMSDLKRLYELFDSDKILVKLYEDFEEDNQKIMKDIFDFLNVRNVSIDRTTPQARKKLRFTYIKDYVDCLDIPTYLDKDGCLFSLLRTVYRSIFVGSETPIAGSDDAKKLVKQDHMNMVRELDTFLSEKEGFPTNHLIKKWGYEKV